MKLVKNVWVLVEQPRGSWMLKLPFVERLVEAYGWMRVSTHLCFFDP